MKRLCIAGWVASLLCVAPALRAEAPPANDLCSAAIAVEAGEFAYGTVFEAGIDGESSCGSFFEGPDVWYRYVAAGDGAAFISAGSINQDFFPVVSVHADCPGTIANELACNAGAIYSQVSLPVTNGTAYLIRVAGSGVASGVFELYVNGPNPPPNNNICANAFEIGDAFSIESNTFSATNDGSASCGNSNLSPDTWYHYAADFSGTLLFQVGAQTSLFEPVLSIHSGCPGTTENEITCDFRDSSFAQAGLTVTAGNDYYIRIAGNEGVSGEFQMFIDGPFLPPVNDSCANARAITAGQFLNSATLGATSDGSSTCEFPYEADVWFAFTPLTTGRAVFACYASSAAGLSVHSGCPGTVENELACSVSDATSTQVDVAVTAGATYWIRIPGDSGSFNSRSLSVGGPFPPAPNDSCAEALPMASEVNQIVSTHDVGVEGEASCGDSNASPAAWFQFTAPNSGEAVFLAQSLVAVKPVVLSLYSACPGDASTELACVAEANARILHSLTEGETYWLRVSGDGGEPGIFYVTMFGPISEQVNETCGNATELVNGFNPGQTFAATTDGSASCGNPSSTGDVWYHFTGAANGLANFQPLDDQFLSPVVSLHSGCPGTTENELACFVDSSGFNLFVTEGTEYWVRVTGAADSTGFFAIDADLPLPPPPNDLCSAAQEICPGVTANGWTLEATTDGAASCGSSNSSPDVWYVYEPGSGGAATASLCGSSYDTVLSVHTACPGTAANQIACDDDSCSPSSFVNFAVEAGTTYYIRVSGFGGNSGEFGILLGGPSCALSGRETGDFDESGCADILDFIFLLDHWLEDLNGIQIGINDFLNLLSGWQLGTNCA